MLSPLTPDGAKHLVNSSQAGWVALAVILAGILIWFDTSCARREAPRVRVTEAPEAESGNPALDLRREITEKLKFRLAAADVHRPAAIPGGSTLDNLATVVSSSDIQGSKTTAMLIRAVNAFAAKPGTYDARLYAEDAPGRRSAGSGSHLRITVDVEDARTGAIIATRTLGPCSKEDAADKAAGFTAAPGSVHARVGSGSLDGEDLSAYLLSQEMSPKSLRPEGLRAYRENQRGALSRVSRSGSATHPGCQRTGPVPTFGSAHRRHAAGADHSVCAASAASRSQPLTIHIGGDARRLRHGASSDACMLGAERGSWASSPAAAGPPQHP